MTGSKSSALALAGMILMTVAGNRLATGSRVGQATGARAALMNPLHE